MLPGKTTGVVSYTKFCSADDGRTISPVFTDGVAAGFVVTETFVVAVVVAEPRPNAI